ncbi:MAG: hypothetical protein L0312_05635 [Acidobacteria bacterium]|nr:hypothetical protein [Acidobacteriota bacterium]
MTAFTDTWNATFEGLPPDTVEAASQGASRIRSFKLAVRERVAVDHSIAGDAHDGKHKQVTLRVQSADPTLDADDVGLYTKADAHGKSKVFLKDEDGAVIPMHGGFSTGDVKLTLKTVADPGWVLMNDTTIGNAASGASGRANADTVALFTLLWTNTADAQCAVSGGRGASAAADYAANKTIALPKALGRALATFGTGVGLTARVMAETLGVETVTLTTSHLPASGLSIPALGAGTLVAASHTHVQQEGQSDSSGVSNTHRLTAVPDDSTPTSLHAMNVGGATATTQASGALTVSGSTSTGTTGNMGTGGAHDNMEPTLFLNTMIKL